MWYIDSSLGSDCAVSSATKQLPRTVEVISRPTVVKVALRPKVSRPVCPGIRPPSGTHQFSFSPMEFVFRQLRLCFPYYGVPPLTCRVYRFLSETVVVGPLLLHTILPKSKSKLSYDRRSVGQSVQVSGHHLAPANNFSSSTAEIIVKHLRIF
jgi:hypothetical protein